MIRDAVHPLPACGPKSSVFVYVGGEPTAIIAMNGSVRGLSASGFEDTDVWPIFDVTV